MTHISKPSLVDSHCHLHHIDLSSFGQNIAEVIQLARDNEVERMLCVCLELDDLPTLHQLADTYPDISTSVGIHPNTVLESEPDAAMLMKQAEHRSCVAIGETGLDYYRTTEMRERERQRARFREHILAARQSSKPLIIHTREAAADTIRLMKEEKADEIGGVMHCFAEDWQVAEQALDLNFYISFSGIVTFKNAVELQSVAKKVPFDRILIETDSPYLAPVPFRGQQNHPALVKHVALMLCELRGIDYERLARQTTENFYQCFRLT